MSRRRSGEPLPFVWICNPDAVNIRICNPLIASGDAYIHCSRISNPTEPRLNAQLNDGNKHSRNIAGT